MKNLLKAAAVILLPIIGLSVIGLVWGGNAVIITVFSVLGVAALVWVILLLKLGLDLWDQR